MSIHGSTAFHGCKVSSAAIAPRFITPTQNGCQAAGASTRPAMAWWKTRVEDMHRHFDQPEKIPHQKAS
jgi:hypothetical protein